MEPNESFTKVIKEELSQASVTDDDRNISILSAFVKSNGSFLIRNGSKILEIETENVKIFRYIYEIIKFYFKDIKTNFLYRKNLKLHKNTKYILEIYEPEEVLKKLCIDFLDTKVSSSLVNSQDKLSGYFAGLFLSSGSCNNPSSTNYHLEISFKDEEYANEILKLTRKIKSCVFNFKIINRRNSFVLYLKKSDLISDFLAFIEASKSCLMFENVRVNRDFSNSTNRLMNCDTYNYKKSVESSQKQIEDIKLIDEKLGINNITNVKIKLLCTLRLDHPDATYSELAEFMSAELESTVSKSNVNHLFRSIKIFAEKFKNE